jgi:hypothetical protein
MLRYVGGAMSDVATICAEFGITVVLPARRRTGGAALETCAASTLQRLLLNWGESQLRDVLLSIVESAEALGYAPQETTGR